MTDTLTCVTNIMDDIPSCTVRDEHEDRCDSWEYSYARGPQEWTEVATGRPCRGCVPRPAEHGMLCTACWRSLEGALRAAPPLVDLLSSYDRLVQQAGGGGSTDPTVPLAPTKLALDEIESYERSRRGRPAEVWVANEAGAIDAVRFTRAVRSGVSAFPDTEKTTVVPRTRCPECQMLVLQWTPPTLEGDPVRIVCRNPACGFELDQGSLDTVRRAHLVDHPAGTTAREWLKQAAAAGTRVVSVCGHEWTATTTRGPSYPPCPDCTTIVNRHQEAPRMRKQTVTVYTKPDCVQCDWTKKWLTNHDVSFEVEDILDEGNLAAVRELGYSAAPVVMVSQGILRDEAHWSGFQPGKLAQFVKVGEAA